MNRQRRDKEAYYSVLWLKGAINFEIYVINIPALQLNYPFFTPMNSEKNNYAILMLVLGKDTFKTNQSLEVFRSQLERRSDFPVSRLDGFQLVLYFRTPL